MSDPFNTYYKYQPPNFTVFPDEVPLPHFEETKKHRAVVGIEIEVEGVELLDGGVAIAPWRPEREGTLRGGWEVVSPALLSNQVIPALQHIKKNLFDVEKGHKFTYRTSVHVHMDCKTMSPDEFCRLLMVYMSVEPLLFQYAGPERTTSKFCVPCSASLGADIFPQMLVMDTKEFFDNHLAMRLTHLMGQHYGAFNVDNLLSPRGKKGGYPYGTVEARHMRGNGDVKLITNWVTMLLLMRKYALETPTAKMEKLLADMNVVSQYHNYLVDIFGPLAEVLEGGNPLNELYKGISRSISNVKAWLIPSPKIDSVGFLKTEAAARIQKSFGAGGRKPPAMGKVVFDDIEPREEPLAPGAVEIQWDDPAYLQQEDPLLRPLPIDLELRRNKLIRKIGENERLRDRWRINSDPWKSYVAKLMELNLELQQIEEQRI